MTEYKPNTKLMKDGIPKVPFNKGWRINGKRWKGTLKHPTRGLLRLQSAINNLKLKVKYVNVVFDPEWRGRFGTCVDGSYIMFLAEVKLPNGSKGYIDIPAVTRSRLGGNQKLAVAKEKYCDRNNIPYLAMFGELLSHEMEFKIQNWLDEHKNPLQ